MSNYNVANIDISELDKHLEKLLDGSDEFLRIEDGESFVQVTELGQPNQFHLEYFNGEKTSSTTKGQPEQLQQLSPASPSQVIKILEEFITTKRVNVTKSWHQAQASQSLADTIPGAQQMSNNKNFQRVLIGLFIFLVVGGALAANGSNAPWWEGAFSGIFGWIYIIGLIFLMNFLSKTIIRLLENASEKAGVPCTVTFSIIDGSGYTLEPKNRKNSKSRKLAAIKTLEFILIIVHIAVIIAYLGLLVYIFSLFG